MKFYYPTSDPSDATYTTWKDDDEAVVIFCFFLLYLSCLGCSYFYLKCTGACACTCSVVFLVRHDVALLVVCFLE